MIEVKTSIARRIRRQLEQKPLTKIEIIRHMLANKEEIEQTLDFMTDNGLLNVTEDRINNSKRYSLK